MITYFFPFPHSAGRGKGIIFVLIMCCVSFALTSAVQAETWKCKQADGTEIYSDRVIGEQCRKMDDLPPLMRVPAAPPSSPEATTPDEKPPTSPEADQVPTPGRGRQIDPPADAAITIRDVKAIPNFNSLLGIAHYQATLLLENDDSVWTAEKVCVNVRFRDFNFIFLDVNQVGCTDSLKPMETRTFTVTYTGLIPPRLFPIRAEATVAFVKWVK